MAEILRRQWHTFKVSSFGVGDFLDQENEIFARIEIKLKIFCLVFLFRFNFHRNDVETRSKPTKSTIYLYGGRYVDSQIVRLNPFLNRICSNFSSSKTYVCDSFRANRQRIPYSIHAHIGTKNVCISPSNFSFTHKARARTHAQAHLHALAFCSLSVLLLLLLLPSLLSLSSMPFLPSMNYLRCCASNQEKKTKHKRRKERNEMKMMASLAAFFAFDIRHSINTQPIGYPFCCCIYAVVLQWQSKSALHVDEMINERRLYALQCMFSLFFSFWYGTHTEGERVHTWKNLEDTIGVHVWDRKRISKQQ